jgi:hypothetical protein
LDNLNSFLIPFLSSAAGLILGGFISYLLQKDKIKHELVKLREENEHALVRLREENKTEFMAEMTAIHYLSHKKYTDRSFDELKKHLGGFEEDELRKILVRAGATRIYRREDGTEMWRLLSRSREHAEKKGWVDSSP